MIKNRGTTEGDLHEIEIVKNFNSQKIILYILYT